MNTPDAARRLLDRALRLYAADTPEGRSLAAARTRLDEPLRVAVAGKVKAGKSTLLNALLGEPLAATDAGECTLVTTWYRYATAPRAAVVLLDGRTQDLVLSRAAQGRAALDLGGHAPHEVARVEVGWPLPFLRDMTLIDTPGIGSLTKEASQRTLELVHAEAGPGVDALVYLMRHRHAADLELLQGFHADTRVAGQDAAAGAVNVIGVLSRADEIGDGGLDAMLRAQDLAERYTRDPQVRELCSGVLPVAGLLAQGAQMITHDELGWLRSYATIPKQRRDQLTLSASRFVAEDEPALGSAERAALLERLGLFGVRMGASLVRLGLETPEQLTSELLARSGLAALRDALLAAYAGSAELLKARSALQALAGVLAAAPRAGSAALLADLEAAVADAADVREHALAVAIRRDGLPGLDAAEAERALRLLRWASPESWTLGREAAPDVDAELRHWRSVANDALLPRRTRQAADLLGRLCERVRPAATG